MNDHALKWRSHLPNLLMEIVENNPTAWALRMPVILTREILVEVATRAAQLNDPALNILMLRLTMYEVPVEDVSALIKQQEARGTFYQYRVERHYPGFEWSVVDFHIDASNDADAVKQFNDKYKGDTSFRLMRCPVNQWEEMK